MTEIEKRINEKEAAAMMGLSCHTLRTYRVRGTGLPYIKQGSRVFYRWTDVLDFCKGKLIEPGDK